MSVALKQFRACFISLFLNIEINILRFISWISEQARKKIKKRKKRDIELLLLELPGRKTKTIHLEKKQNYKHALAMNHSLIILTVLNSVFMYTSQGSPIKLSPQTFHMYYVYKLSCVLVSMKKYFATADFQVSSDLRHLCLFYGLHLFQVVHTPEISSTTKETSKSLTASLFQYHIKEHLH